jgi:quercetin dioxygenase-like cupin family protein
MNMTPGVTREHQGIDGLTWNILGQTYVPKLASENAFVWYAEFPPETFVPPHIHPNQDEWIAVLEGEFELMLAGDTARAGPGDTIRLPMKIPHGIFNKTGGTVKCIFGVAPTGKLFDLFQKIHNVGDPGEVVKIAAAHDIEFLPPPPGA